MVVNIVCMMCDIPSAPQLPRDAEVIGMDGSIACYSAIMEASMSGGGCDSQAREQKGKRIQVTQKIRGSRFGEKDVLHILRQRLRKVSRALSQPPGHRDTLEVAVTLFTFCQAELCGAGEGHPHL